MGAKDPKHTPLCLRQLVLGMPSKRTATPPVHLVQERGVAAPRGERFMCMEGSHDSLHPQQSQSVHMLPLQREEHVKSHHEQLTQGHTRTHRSHQQSAPASSQLTAEPACYPAPVLNMLCSCDDLLREIHLFLHTRGVEPQSRGPEAIKYFAWPYGDNGGCAQYPAHPLQVDG